MERQGSVDADRGGIDGSGGGGPAPLLAAFLEEHAAPGLEPGPAAADRFLRGLAGSSGCGRVWQRVQVPVGVVPQARRGRGQLPLEPARRRERRAARRAGSEELAEATLVRSAGAGTMYRDPILTLKLPS